MGSEDEAGVTLDSNQSAIQSTGMVEGARDAQHERPVLMLDPWLTSSHRAVRAITANLIGAHEALTADSRQRRRKARDRENFTAVATAIVANLALAVASQLDPPTVGVSLRAARRSSTRYEKPGFTALPKVLEALREGGGLLTLSKSRRKGVASAITAGPDFAEALGRFNWRGDHFGEAPGRETVWLSRTERDYVRDTATVELIDYPDDPVADRYRAEMAAVNGMLLSADLRMEDDGGPRVITSARRVLRRQFKLLPDDTAARFDLGGRLFGGWWQNLDKARRPAIRINGETVAELDFSSMFLRLAYLEAGVTPPDGDLYAAVPGLSEPRWRQGVKLVASSMLFREAPLLRLPAEAKAILPRGATGPGTRAAILEAHPSLAGVFERGLGLNLMFRESQVLAAALGRLVEKRVVALPIHDALLVPLSRAAVAAQAMREASEEVVGFQLPITIKAAL